jgi:hypothetical protein
MAVVMLVSIVERESGFVSCGLQGAWPAQNGRANEKVKGRVNCPQVHYRAAVKGRKSAVI